MGLIHQELKNIIKNSIVLEKRENIEIKENSNEFVSTKKTFIRKKVICQPEKDSINKILSKRKFQKSQDLQEDLKEPGKQDTYYKERDQSLQCREEFVLGQRKERKKQHKKKSKTWADHLTEDNCGPEIAKERFFPRDSEGNKLTPRPRKRSVATQQQGAQGDHKTYRRNRYKDKNSREILNKSHLTSDLPNMISKQQMTVQCCYSCMQHSLCPFRQSVKTLMCRHFGREQTPTFTTNHECTYCQDDYYLNCSNCKTGQSQPKDGETQYCCCLAQHKNCTPKTRRRERKCPDAYAKNNAELKQFIENKIRECESTKQQIKKRETNSTNAACDKNVCKAEKLDGLLSKSEASELLECFHRYIDEREKLKNPISQCNLNLDVNKQFPGDRSTGSSLVTTQQYSQPTLEMLKKMKIHAYKPHKPSHKMPEEQPKLEIINDKQPFKKLKNYQKYVQKFAKNEKEIEKSIIEETIKTSENKNSDAIESSRRAEEIGKQIDIGKAIEDFQLKSSKEEKETSFLCHKETETYAYNKVLSGTTKAKESFEKFKFAQDEAKTLNQEDQTRTIFSKASHTDPDRKRSDQLDLIDQFNHQKKLKDFNNETKVELLYQNYQMNKHKKFEDMETCQSKKDHVRDTQCRADHTNIKTELKSQNHQTNDYKKFEDINAIQAKDLSDDYKAIKDRAENSVYQSNTYDDDHLKKPIDLRLKILQNVYANKLNQSREIESESREYKEECDILSGTKKHFTTEDKYESRLKEQTEPYIPDKITSYPQSNEKLKSGQNLTYNNSREMFAELNEYDEERNKTLSEKEKHFNYSAEDRYGNRFKEQPEPYDPKRQTYYPQSPQELRSGQNPIYNNSRERIIKKINEYQQKGAETLRETQKQLQSPAKDKPEQSDLYVPEKATYYPQSSEELLQRHNPIYENLKGGIFKEVNESIKEGTDILRKIKKQLHHSTEDSYESRFKQQIDPYNSRKGTYYQNMTNDQKQEQNSIYENSAERIFRDSNEYDKEIMEVLSKTKNQSHFPPEDKYESNFKEQSDPDNPTKTASYQNVSDEVKEGQNRATCYQNPFRKQDQNSMRHISRETIFSEINRYGEHAKELEREEIWNESKVSRSREQLARSREIRFTMAYDVYNRMLQEQYAMETEKEKIFSESLDPKGNEKLAGKTDGQKEIRLGFKTHAKAFEDQRFEETANEYDQMRQHNSGYQHIVYKEVEKEQYQNNKEFKQRNFYESQLPYEESSGAKTFDEAQDNNNRSSPGCGKNTIIKHTNTQHPNIDHIREGINNDSLDHYASLDKPNEFEEKQYMICASASEKVEAHKHWQYSIKTSKEKDFHEQQNEQNKLHKSQAGQISDHLKERALKGDRNGEEFKQKTFQISESLKEWVSSKLHKYERVLIRNKDQENNGSRQIKYNICCQLNPMKHPFWLTEQRLSESQNHYEDNEDKSLKMSKFDKFQELHQPSYSCKDKNNSDEQNYIQYPKEILSSEFRKYEQVLIGSRMAGTCDETQNNNSSKEDTREYPVFDSLTKESLPETQDHYEDAKRLEQLQDNKEPSSFESLEQREAEYRASNPRPIDDVIKQEANHASAFKPRDESCSKEKATTEHDEMMDKSYSSNCNNTKRLMAQNNSPIEKYYHRKVDEENFKEAFEKSIETEQEFLPLCHQAKDVLNNLNAWLNNAVPADIKENECFKSTTKAAEEFISKLSSCMSLEAKQLIVDEESLREQIKARPENSVDVKSAQEAQFKDLETSPDSSDVQLKTAIKEAMNLPTLKAGRANELNVIAQADAVPTKVNIIKDCQKESLSEELPTNDYFNQDFCHIETRIEAPQMYSDSREEIITESNSSSEIDLQHEQPMCSECQLETARNQENCCSTNSESCYPFTAPIPAFKQCPCMWNTYVEMLLNYYKGRKQYDKF